MANFEDLPLEMIKEKIIRLPLSVIHQILHFLAREDRQHIIKMHTQLVNGRRLGYLVEGIFPQFTRYSIHSNIHTVLRVLQAPLNINQFRLIAGCSNGILCDVFVDFETELVQVTLSNPFLQESRRLPNPNLEIDLNFYDLYSFGFLGGHTDAYRVVRIIQRDRERAAEIFRSNEDQWITIYPSWPSLSEHRVQLERNPPLPLLLQERPATIFRGDPYYLALDGESQSYKAVVAFSLNEERFRIVKEFVYQVVTVESQPRLGVFGDHLAIGIVNPNGGYRVCEVSNDAEQWTQYAEYHPLNVIQLDQVHSAVVFRHAETLVQIL